MSVMMGNKLLEGKQMPIVRSFDTDALPEAGTFLTMDTSFVFEVWGEPGNINRQAGCYNFIDRLTRGGSFLLTTIKLHEELRILVPSKEIGGRRHLKKALSGNTSALVPCVDKINEIEQALMELSNYYPEPVGSINHTLLDEVDKLMRLGIEYGDAAHYVLSKSEAINHFITLDGDFCRIPDESVVIYTDPTNYNRLMQNNNSNKL